MTVVVPMFAPTSTKTGSARRPDPAGGELGEPVRQRGHVAALAADEHAPADAGVVGGDEEDLVAHLDGDVRRHVRGRREERLACLEPGPPLAHVSAGSGAA